MDWILPLQDVENIVALPHEAAEAEDMLRDDTQLLQVMMVASVCRTSSSGHDIRKPSQRQMVDM